MAFCSINPANGETLAEYPSWDQDAVEQALTEVAGATSAWAALPVEERCRHLKKVADVLRDRAADLARLISLEMGKRIVEARGEIEKCAWVCEYYADAAPGFLADELIESDAGKSLVSYQPLGTVLAVMPWNFPFWQVFRFAAPTLAAGNTAVLKHASNVPQCALAIESVFLQAGLPRGVFRTLMIGAGQVGQVIEDPRIHAVTLTGSEPAGREVAATAGANLKKTVMELGGSDAFVVLEDADLALAADNAVASRFLNTGQSCIAAKRFIVTDAVADRFLDYFKKAVEALVTGDPQSEATTLGPMARDDLRDELHRQVMDSVAQGARIIVGGHPVEGPGAYYAATIIDNVRSGQRAYHEELFGPVAIVIRVADEAEAMRVANDSVFGLGGSVWTEDKARGERFARRMECGCAFVNGHVKSDPRLPFGGVKHSGYGRELSRHGIMEFVNAKTLWIR